MDDENRKGKGINAVTRDEGAECQQEEESHKEQQMVEVWSDEWQCYICGVMTKSLSPVNRTRDDEGEEDGASKAPRSQEHQESK